MKLPLGIRLPEVVLALAGVLLLGTWAKTEAESRIWQMTAERQLRAIERAGSFQDESAAGARAAARARGIVGRIQVPRLALAAAVGEGTGRRTLSRAVGHLRSSALPGESGNVVLAGHRDTHFRKLRKIRRNDLIRVTTPDGTFRYRVERIQVVSPDRTDVLERGDRAALTLVTCYPFHAIGPAPERFVVRARPVETNRGS
jgi:sortase A